MNSTYHYLVKKATVNRGVAVSPLQKDPGLGQIIEMPNEHS